MKKNKAPEWHGLISILADTYDSLLQPNLSTMPLMLPGFFPGWEHLTPQHPTQQATSSGLALRFTTLLNEVDKPEKETETELLNTSKKMPTTFLWMFLRSSRCVALSFTFEKYTDHFKSIWLLSTTFLAFWGADGKENKYYKIYTTYTTCR